MAAPELVDQDMVLGYEAMGALSKDVILRPTGFFWLFDKDEDDWRLMVVTRNITQRGPRDTYTRIRKGLDKAGLLDRLPLGRVDAIPPTDKMVKAIRALLAARFFGERPKGVKLTNVYFPDLGKKDFEVTNLYVYRL